MVRSRFVLVALLGLVFVSACNEEDGKPTETTDSGVPFADTDNPDDTDDTDVPAPSFVLGEGAVLSALPATLPDAEGGLVSYRIRAFVTNRTGEPASMAEALDGAVIVVTLPDGGAVEAVAEALGDDEMQVSVDIPAGLAPQGGVLSGALSYNDTFLVHLPIRVHEAAEPTLAGFLAGTLPGIDLSDFAEVCDAVAVETDGDKHAEVLVTGRLADGSNVARACVFADAAADPPAWRCDDEVLTGTKDQVCGQTNHFRYASGEVGISTMFEDPSTYSRAVGTWTWSGGSWSGPGTSSNLSSTGLFGVVLGINNTKSEPARPTIAELGLRGGGDGKWFGVYRVSDVAYEWSAMGGITPQSVGEGEAYAGLFSDVDLEPVAGGGADVWAWTIDPSALATGGKLKVGVLQWSDRARAFVGVRDVDIAAPTFRVDAATAAGQDLDGDGIPELVVEVWGEGAYSAWVVRDATDQTSTKPVVTLRSPESGMVLNPAAFSFDGTTPTVSSSTMTARGSDLCAMVQTIDAVRMDGGPPLGSTSVACWDIFAAFDADAAEADRAAGAPIGEIAIDSVCADRSGGGGTRGRGVCIFGDCVCVAGGGGSVERVAGEGDGASAESDPLSVGDLAVLMVDDVSQHLIVGRAFPVDGSAPRRPRLAWSEDGETVVAYEHHDDSGAWLEGNGDRLLDLQPGAFLASVDDGLGRRAQFQWVWRSEVSTSSGAPLQATNVGLEVMVVFTDGVAKSFGMPLGDLGLTSVPVFLDRSDQDSGELLLGWRDGVGQAWLGTIHLDSLRESADGDLPFAQGPVAVGGPVTDGSSVFGLGPSEPGMVSVSRDVGADPFLDVEGVSMRFDDWDAPMEVSFAGYDKPFDPILFLAANREGDPVILLLSSFAQLTDAIEIDAHVADDPADLPVPRTMGRLLPDAPAVAVSTSANGAVVLDAIDGEGNRASTASFFDRSLSFAGGVHVAAGDLNGDGLDDLVFGSGATTTFGWSDGRVRDLGEGDVDASLLTNFGVLLGASGGHIGGDLGDPLQAVVGRPRFGNVTLMR